MSARQPMSNSFRAVALAVLAAVALPDTTLANRGASLPLAITQTDRGSRAEAMIGDCPAALERDDGQAAGTVFLHLRNDCDQPFGMKLRLLQEMARALIGNEPPAARVTLFIGRVVQTFPDMALQAAQAAVALPAWDATRARADARYANDLFAQAIAGTEDAQFVRIVATWLTQTRVSVEKVLIAPPSQTPFADALSGDEPVPFDALTYFVFE